MEHRKNQLVTVDITDMGAAGEGVGRLEDGYTLFVKDGVIGDRVIARIVKSKKSFAFARLEEILTPSPHRVEPLCAYARACGGCQLQALSYGKQLEFKENKVRNNLARIGGFAPEEIAANMEPILGMDRPFFYRNKAQFPVGTDKEGRLIVGFYAGRSHRIIENRDCVLGAPENRRILDIILDFCQEKRITAYDEDTQKGLLRHILIRKGLFTGQLLACLVINGERLPDGQRLADRLMAQVPGLVGVCVNCNRTATNVILGDRTYTLRGVGAIEDTIGGLRFQISPASFYQVNPVQTERIYAQVMEYAGLTGKETVWDLYCGIGTISLYLARRAKQVYGVEISPRAVADARENARRNGLENAVFFDGKAEEVLPEKYEKENIWADVVVVDPPRKGCDRACLDTILRMAPKRLVYVSCDSATLARDMKILCENGYVWRKGRAFDNFPQGVHVETVVLLSRKKQDRHINAKLAFGEGEGTIQS